MSLKNWALAIFLTLFAGLLVFISSDSEATYTILRDASNLSRGTLPNARLDPSSVTLQGNEITLNSSSTTLQGNAFNGANQLLQLNSSGLSPNANIDPSSITKQGNAFTLNPSSVTFQGNTFTLNPSSVTFQGNTFNGVNQLIKTDANSLISNLNVDPSSVTKAGPGPFLSSGAALVNSFHLNTTGVTGETYGSVSGIPKITVGTDGRITAIATNTVSATASQLYSVIMGTTTTRNPSVVASSSTHFTTAIASMGVTTYAGGTIFVTAGEYTVADTTIPAGLELICESSAIFKNDISGGKNRTMFTVYGTIRNCGFDITQLQSSYAPIIDLKSGGQFLRNKFYRLSLHVGLAGGVQDMIKVATATNVEISDNSFNNISLTGAQVLAKLISLESSTNVFINRNYFSLSSATNTFKGGNPLIFVQGGTNINITDNWGYAAGSFVYMTGSTFPYLAAGLNVSNNRLMVAAQIFGSNAVFNLTGPASSGTVINNNYLEMLTEGNINIFSIGSVGFYSNPVVSNNIITVTDGAMTGTFVKIFDSNVKNAVIQGNHVLGLSAFITDNGSGTTYTTLGNFMGNVQQ